MFSKCQYQYLQLPALVDPSVEESYLGAAMHRNPADSGNGRASSDREAKLLTRITR
jgi:hypothetical protein